MKFSRLFLVLIVFTFLSIFGSEVASAEDRDKNKKELGGFVEPKEGNVPDGALELITPDTDRAIERGLSWLANQQRSGGSFGEPTSNKSTAVTSIVGLAFLSYGSTPNRGKYGAVLQKAVQYIGGLVTNSGLIGFGDGTSNLMYGHGFATLFLAEVYGMTKDPDIREKLSKAVRLIIDTQNKNGGWRYEANAYDADISVTVCQMNALRAARNAGLYVPKETMDNSFSYVKKSQTTDGGFMYQVTGGSSAFPRSAAGLVGLYSFGDYQSDEVKKALAYLETEFKKSGTGYSHHYYAIYYYAQALWIHGGDKWNDWYAQIRDAQLKTQMPDGHWQDPNADEYGTAMSLVVLQMPNSYLPIMQR